MAKAIKVPDDNFNVVLTLSAAEARLVYSLVGNLTGGRTPGLRQTNDAVYYALQDIVGPSCMSVCVVNAKLKDE